MLQLTFRVCSLVLILGLFATPTYATDPKKSPGLKELKANINDHIDIERHVSNAVTLRATGSTPKSSNPWGHLYELYLNNYCAAPSELFDNMDLFVKGVVWDSNNGVTSYDLSGFGIENEEIMVHGAIEVHDGNVASTFKVYLESSHPLSWPKPETQTVECALDKTGKLFGEGMLKRYKHDTYPHHKHITDFQCKMHVGKVITPNVVSLKIHRGGDSASLVGHAYFEIVRRKNHHCIPPTLPK